MMMLPLLLHSCCCIFPCLFMYAGGSFATAWASATGYGANMSAVNQSPAALSSLPAGAIVALRVRACTASGCGAFGNVLLTSGSQFFFVFCFLFFCIYSLSFFIFITKEIDIHDYICVYSIVSCYVQLFLRLVLPSGPIFRSRCLHHRTYFLPVREGLNCLLACSFVLRWVRPVSVFLQFHFAT
jgi:hypothetical protein